MRYEKFGGKKMRFIAEVAGLVVFLSLLSMRDFKLIENLYRTVFVDPTGFIWRGSPMGPFWMAFGFQSLLALPRPEWLYPISRVGRAQVAFAASAWQLLSIVAIVAGSLIAGASIVGLWLGKPLDAHAAGRFILSFSPFLPFVPLALWGRMHDHIRQDKAMSMLCILGAFVGAAITQGIFHLTHLDRITLGAVAIVVTSIAASQWLFYRALRRFYREGDLLQRGTKRQNFSLI